MRGWCVGFVVATLFGVGCNGGGFHLVVLFGLWVVARELCGVVWCWF